MDCKKVKEIMPEYIVEICTADEKKNIDEHIKNCSECRSCFEKMKNESDNIEKQDESDQRKTINRIQRKFTMKIIKVTVLVILSIFIAVAVIPTVLRGVRYGQNKKARAAVTNFYQFTSGKYVGGSGLNLGIYEDKISVYTHWYMGSKITGGTTQDFKYNLLTNKVKIDFWLDIIAVDPQIEPSDSIKELQNVEVAKKILDKNGDDTVSVVDVSLNDFISYEKAVEYLNKYDMKVLWMSIDSGMEEKKVLNMSNGKNQHFQFGIPGKLLNTSNYKIKELSKDNGKEFKEFALLTLKDLNKNIDLLEPGDMRKRAGYKKYVLDGEVEYILSNGIKVYGLQITGPSDELSRFLEDIKPRLAYVRDIDFWYWDK